MIINWTDGLKLNISTKKKCWNLNENKNYIVLLEFTIILRINSQRIQLANAFNSVFFFVARQLVQFLSSILNHTYVRPLHIQRHQIS